MRDGDVLYLPRGWWHEAAGCGDPTLHLTFGITKRSGITFMEWLVDELRRFPIFRADLPRFADQETQRGHAKAMLDALLASWDDAGVDRYLTSQDVRARLRPWLNLPLAAGVDLLPAVESIVSLAIPRQVPIHQTGTSVTIAALGREWEFDALVGEMLERLQAGPATVGEIAALLSPSAGPGEAQKFVADLVRRGLLLIDYPTVAEALP
jgi:hypothetical protein